MKTFIILLFILLGFISCNTTKNTTNSKNNSSITNDTVKIANEELEYEIIIIDPGFNTWIASRAYPRGYHTENYLINKNRVYVNEWNFRAMQPTVYSNKLYAMQIDYNPNTNYGYEVNYLLYNYFIYFQNKYNQKLAGFVPSR
jgi:hypothetical protein